MKASECAKVFMESVTFWDKLPLDKVMNKAVKNLLFTLLNELRDTAAKRKIRLISDPLILPLVKEGNDKWNAVAKVVNPWFDGKYSGITDSYGILKNDGFEQYVDKFILHKDTQIQEKK